MAGDSSVDESQLKGLSKYFNSQTNRGRANVSIQQLYIIALKIKLIGYVCESNKMWFILRFKSSMVYQYISIHYMGVLWLAL